MRQAFPVPSSQRRLRLYAAKQRPVSGDPSLHSDDEICAAPAPNGFTLVELMVVIVIIGLLTTIVVINVLPSQEKARVEKAKADIALLEQASEMYRLDNLSYPSGGDGLQALVSAPVGGDASHYRSGGYIRKLPQDPWGNPYHYEAPGKHGAIDIFSYGADGREGGEGNDADIGNWK
jgi:general secretion pathway protein G